MTLRDDLNEEYRDVVIERNALLDKTPIFEQQSIKDKYDKKMRSIGAQIHAIDQKERERRARIANVDE